MSHTQKAENNVLTEDVIIMIFFSKESSDDQSPPLAKVEVSADVSIKV